MKAWRKDDRQPATAVSCGRPPLRTGDSVIKLKELHDKNLDEKFVASEEVFHGRLLKVRRDQVVLPNGVETTRELIRHPGALAIVPVLEDGSIVFVKQYRYPVGTVLYEIPAGKLEPGEDPAACAPRELSEETGYDADRLDYLTSIVTTPGFTDEVIHLYKATGLTMHSQHPDADEFINVVRFTPAQVRQLILDHSIYDSKTLAALGFLQML